MGTIDQPHDPRGSSIGHPKYGGTGTVREISTYEAAMAQQPVQLNAPGIAYGKPEGNASLRPPLGGFTATTWW